jgi:hypothetical protein
MEFSVLQFVALGALTFVFVGANYSANAQTGFADRRG